MGWKDVASGITTHLSDTQIRMYIRCPRQFWFRYVKKRIIPPTGPMVLGSSVHSSIEHNYLHKFERKGKPAPKDEVLDSFSDAFKERLKTDRPKLEEPPGKMKDRGYHLAELHYSKVAPSVQPLEKPEMGFEVKVSGLKRTLLGYVDCLARIGQAAKRFIIDNKVSRRKWQQWEVDVSPQLTAYSYAHRILYGKLPDGQTVDAVLDLKGSLMPQRVYTARTAEEMRRFEVLCQQVEKGIDAGVFPPCDNHQTCSWCGYLKECSASAFARRARPRF